MKALAVLCLAMLAGCSGSDGTAQNKAAEIGYHSGMTALRTLIGGSCRGCNAGMSAADASIGRDLATPAPPPAAPRVAR